MRYFLAIARRGTLRAAAMELGGAHGTVKRRLESLESTYGVQLFRRTKRGLTLTLAGRDLLPVAEEAETLFRSARRQLQGRDKDESGVVRFSMTGVMAYEIVSPILVKFFAEYPEIDLEIRVTDQFDDINRLEIDVSFRFAHEIHDDVVAQKLYPMAMGVYASRDYLDRHLRTAGPNGAGLHWIGWDKVARHPDWVEEFDFPEAEVRHATRDHVLRLSLLKRGFGMMSTSVYFAELYPELVLVP